GGLIACALQAREFDADTALVERYSPDGTAYRVQEDPLGFMHDGNRQITEVNSGSEFSKMLSNRHGHRCIPELDVCRARACRTHCGKAAMCLLPQELPAREVAVQSNREDEDERLHDVLRVAGDTQKRHSVVDGRKKKGTHHRTANRTDPTPQ